MKIISKVARRIIYAFSEKPAYYVHVDKPKTLQEYRQVQYNNWCKAKGVYNGSYLPKNPDKLKESGKKGWTEWVCLKDRTGEHRHFQRKSDGQKVDFHYKKLTRKGVIADEHYHWFNELSSNRNTLYRDRYGNVCGKKSNESHLAPLDKKYNFK